VYIPKIHRTPSPEAPIAQTYVDTILRGCLSISEEFAREFLLSTKGWHPAELDDINDDDDDDDNDSRMSAESAGHWVDDRDEPIYPRGDRVWSRRNSEDLDELIRRYQPVHFESRQPIATES
jgi:hypothetical protein